MTIDAPKYLLHLLNTFKHRGGHVTRASIQHLSQLFEGAYRTTTPDAVVVCAGIGARTLGGVEDKSVFPSRG